MKRIQLFIVSFLGCTTLVCAQLSGSVVDVTGTAIPYANAMILSAADSVLQTGAITNEAGIFEIEFSKEGTYVLRINLLSFQTYDSEPFEISGVTFKKTFPSITLLEEVTSLQGVEVIAQRKLIQRTQEGTVMHVQSSILTKGSSALQLLERSPGVILDLRNNSFSLNGKSGTLIMINGKAQRIPTADLISLLNGMSADTIEKIELLTNPSARYDVDGNAGIINIVLAKNETLGIRGNLNLSTGFGEGPKQTSGLSVNYGSERTTLFGSYTFSYDDSYGGFRGIGTTEIAALGGNTAVDFINRRQQISRNHNINLSYDFALSENASFGANLLYNRSRPLILTQNRGLYTFTDRPFLDAQIRLNGDGNLKNSNASAYFETKTTSNSLTITADYINYNNQSPNRVNSSYFDANGNPFQPDNEIYNRGNQGFNETTINVGVLKIDYRRSVTTDLSLEGGIKGSLSKTINDARIEVLQGDDFVVDHRFVSSIENQEKIAAAYTIVDYAFHKRMTAQMGLRYEYWNQAFDDPSLDRSFGKLFPSVFITRSFSDTTALNFAYNKRITRPNYSDLASFLIYNSPTSVFSGNPQLLPAITDNISLTYDNKSFSISLLASNENNPIARFQVTSNAESNVAVIAPVNLDYQRNIDLQANIPFRLTSWWNMNLNGTAGVRQFKLLHTDQKITHDYVHFNFNGNHSIQLPANFSLELSGWYTSLHFNGSSRVSGFGVLNGGIKKEFNNGSSLQFSVNDIFQSFDVRSNIGSLTREAFGNAFDVRYSPESGFSRIFRIAYSYPFGNKKVKNAKTKTGADTEKSRL